MEEESGDSSLLKSIDAYSAKENQKPAPSQQLEEQQVAAPRQVTPPSTSTKESFPFPCTSTGDSPAAMPDDANKRAKTCTAALDPTSNASTKITDELLETTLQKYFGFEGFRPGQKEVLQALLQKQQDVAVFWATGNGKSLCFQLPALVTGKITICISPLISLMQDQVRKLNHSLAPIAGKPKIATYLGSAQKDPQEEQKALRGDYLMVYVTPEKLSSSWFLRALEPLAPKIGLFAFDEAHCVSQWGHDFRPQYRQAGMALRNKPKFSQIPIMALTATAVPTIQDDICRSLQLREPFVEKQSLDRPNLQISVKPKSSNDPGRCAMDELARHLGLEAKHARALSSSTIVYAPTRKLVEELADTLQERLDKTNLGKQNTGELARAYHGGMDTGTRQEIHEAFLTGQLPIVVATTAFGMGIDKPDIRRVVHFGPPKNVEEYYQQIGRAGRDGKPSQCWMYYNSSDFDKYKTDFYIGKLEGKAKENAIASTDALKKYSLDSQTCRRKALLDFFQETAPFERCGTCDTCMAKKNPAANDDSNRDFGYFARFVMCGVKVLKAQGITILLKVLKGHNVEGYRYAHKMAGSKFDKVRKQVEAGLPCMKVSDDLLKEVLFSLVSLDYIRTSVKKYKQNGFTNKMTVYSLSSKGDKALKAMTQPIVLPVPKTIRHLEEQQAKKRQELKEQLAKKGMHVPEDELQNWDGPAVRAYSTWFDSMKRKEEQGRDTAIYDELLELIEGWRSQTAIQQKMAPVAVMAEHLVFSAAYMTSSLLPGCKIEAPALVAMGVRSSTVNELVNVLNDWLERNKKESATTAAASNESLAMVAPAGLIKMPKWKHAVYRVMKKLGEPYWMSSYIRFMKGKETIQEIAMTKRKDRPIQAATVVGHLQEAMQLGYPIDLQRLLPNSNAPTKQEWERLEKSIASRKLNVVGDPETSGRNGGKFYLTDCLRGILGDAICDKKQSRSSEESERFVYWINRLKWVICFKRVGFVPSFGSASSEGVALAADATKYTVPTTKKEDKLMAKQIGTKKWIVPTKVKLEKDSTKHA